MSECKCNWLHSDVIWISLFGRGATVWSHTPSVTHKSFDTTSAQQKTRKNLIFITALKRCKKCKKKENTHAYTPNRNDQQLVSVPILFLFLFYFFIFSFIHSCAGQENSTHINQIPHVFCYICFNSTVRRSTHFKLPQINIDSFSTS